MGGGGGGGACSGEIGGKRGEKGGGVAGPAKWGRGTGVRTAVKFAQALYATGAETHQFIQY